MDRREYIFVIELSFELSLELSLLRRTRDEKTNRARRGSHVLPKRPFKMTDDSLIEQENDDSRKSESSAHSEPVKDGPVLTDWKPGPRYLKDARRHCVLCAPKSAPNGTSISTENVVGPKGTEKLNNSTPGRPSSAPQRPPLELPPKPPPRPDHCYEADVTMVLITSAIAMHPDTSLLDAVLHSACRSDPILARCRKIIVADAPRTIWEDKNKKSDWKSGKFNAKDVDRYYTYLDRVEGSCRAGHHPYHFTELVRAPKFRGFALALKMGLERCTTPYAVVFQHDRIILRPFGLDRMLRLLRAAPDQVKYVGLASNSTINILDEKLALSTIGMSPTIHGTGSFSFEGQEFVPLHFWYDSTHVASVRYYLDHVFVRRWLTDGSSMNFRVGDFVEDKWGQAMRADLKTNGLSVHSKYGCFIAVPEHGEKVVVQHCNGRAIGSTKNRKLGYFLDDLDWEVGGEEEEQETVEELEVDEGSLARKVRLILV